MAPISLLITCTSLAGSVAASLYNEKTNNHTCALVPDYLSCSSNANASLVDSCCVETYGGLLLQTQFWNTYTGRESQGQYLVPNTWTIHGLWPDFCNGSYTQYCDLNRQYDPQPSPNTTNGLPNGTVVPPYNGSSVASFIQSFGKNDLLAYMNRYWIAQNQPNNYFWQHEFSKHATCFSTFDVPCYGPKYVKHQEVIEFYETVIKYYQKLPTWSWLTAHGITPSNTTTYTLADLENALSREYGAVPYVGCSGPRYNETSAGTNSTDNGRVAVSEVWYYFHAFGRPQDGHAVPTDQTGKSNCVRKPRALHYYEPSNGSVSNVFSA